MADLGELRDRIAAGEYRLDAASIASALLGYAGLDEVSSQPGVRQPAESSKGGDAQRKR